MRRKSVLMIVLLAACLLCPVSLGAQEDGLILPSELYFLLNSGQVHRYSTSAGVAAVTPEDFFVLDFAVAPDNNLLAFRTEDGLSLLNMYDAGWGIVALEDSRADVPPIRGQGDSMAWSPLGDALAYTTLYGARVFFDGPVDPVFVDLQSSPLKHLAWSPGGVHLAAEAENNVWWIYRRDGTAMTLVSALPSSFGLAWFDDARLIFAPDEGGLLMMDLASANQQTVLLDTSRAYRYPALRADGTIAVFSRGPDDDPTSGTWMRVQVNPNLTAGAAETGLSPVDLTDMRWAPGGTVLVAFRGGALALALPATGEGFALPISNAVAYSWGMTGPRSVTGVTTTHHGLFRAADGGGVMQIWQLAADGFPPLPITFTASDITAFAPAARHASIVFVSEDRLWLTLLDDQGYAGDPLLLAAPEEQINGLAISADGQMAAYSVFSADTGAAGVWLVPAAGGDPRELLVNATDQNGFPASTFVYTDLRFSPDGARLLATQRSGEAVGFVAVDLAEARLIPLGLGYRAQWLSDGRIVIHAADEGSLSSTALYVVDPASGETPSRTPVLRAGDTWIHAMQETAPGTVRVALSQLSRRVPAATTLVEVAVDGGEPDDLAGLGFVTAPVIAPDGLFVAGYTHPGGSLLLYNISQGQVVSLASPGAVYDFIWVTFR